LTSSEKIFYKNVIKGYKIMTDSVGVMLRTDLGLFGCNKGAIQSPIDAAGYQCNLHNAVTQLGFVSPHDKLPVGFYFAIHISQQISDGDPKHHFACIGDQIGDGGNMDLVFIAAVHKLGSSLPSFILCLESAEFMRWLFPCHSNDDTPSPQPPSHAVWASCKALEFCRTIDQAHSFRSHFSSEEIIHKLAPKVVQALANLTREPNWIADQFPDPTSQAASYLPDSDSDSNSEPDMIENDDQPDMTENDDQPRPPNNNLKRKSESELPIRTQPPRGCLKVNSNVASGSRDSSLVVPITEIHSAAIATAQQKAAEKVAAKEG
jgi:hypothetical protein